MIKILNRMIFLIGNEVGSKLNIKAFSFKIKMMFTEDINKALTIYELFCKNISRRIS